ncbi:hypothetical protein UY3_08848 [Chelonia mydas]|uniref:Uncharacterized protein n=1 Tax=Chelonia mydas TaxID=8469 RepID=M7C0T3_CHEMY|nr:hypothetical protein UY3_08848 [Chelonia mydas]
MASLKSFGRAGQRQEEENGELDRSLQQMLRAIVEERNRINIRQEISGLAPNLGCSQPAYQYAGHTLSIYVLESLGLAAVPQQPVYSHSLAFTSLGYYVQGDPTHSSAGFSQKHVFCNVQSSPGQFRY